MSDENNKNLKETNEVYANKWQKGSSSRAMESSVTSKFPSARYPPPTYSPLTYGKNPIEETMHLPPPIHASAIPSIDASTAAQELEKGERVFVRSPEPGKRLIFYPYSTPGMHGVEHDNYFKHGEVGFIVDKYFGSKYVLYNVELSRGAKGWISRKCIERYKSCHEGGHMPKFSPIAPDIDQAKSKSSLEALEMRISTLEKLKEEAAYLEDYGTAQRFKEEIIALKSQYKKHETLNKKYLSRSKRTASNSECVYETAVDKFTPRKSRTVASQDLVAAQSSTKKIPDLKSFGPQVSFDDGKSWQTLHKRNETKRKNTVYSRGIVLNLGFGSFSITEHMGGREALETHGFEVAYCKLSSKETNKYDHHIYESDAKKNLYDYAREKLVPFIRRLAKKGRCPVALLAGSRGGQETLQYIWKHCYRGPTICLNASCIATTIAESYPYRGVHYTMENSPCHIPLVVTTSDNDELGFEPCLAKSLCELYQRRDHVHLIAQYHCSGDSHVPESVPGRLGLLVRLAVGLSACASVASARNLPCVGELVKSFFMNSYATIGGVKL